VTVEYIRKHMCYHAYERKLLMSQAENNAKGEAAHRRHVLKLIDEWADAVNRCDYADYATLAVSVRSLVEAGEALVDALSAAVLGIDLEGDPDEQTSV
jgi:hypothetical protein